MPQMITASVSNFIHGVLNGVFRRIERNRRERQSRKSQCKMMP